MTKEDADDALGRSMNEGPQGLACSWLREPQPSDNLGLMGTGKGEF